MNSRSTRVATVIPGLLFLFGSTSPAEPKTEEPGEVAIDESSHGSGATRAETPAQRDARLAWWGEAKFGMVIHWGVYSVPARNGERVMRSEKMPVATYRAFAKDFTVANHDPAAWAALAKEAGMKYMFITANHQGIQKGDEACLQTSHCSVTCPTLFRSG